MLEIQVNNPSAVPVSLTSLALTASGSGLDDAGVAAIEIWLDIGGDGTVNIGDSQLAVAIYPYPSDNGTVVFALNHSIPPSSTASYLVLYDFSSTAPAGTYVAGVNDGGISGTSPYGPISVNGLPITGAIITVMEPTATPTITATRTWTATPTHTAIPTATHTFTPPPTATWTPTNQPALTLTPTLTSTLPPGPDTETIETYAYPNPVSGNLLNFSVVLKSSGTAHVRVYNAGGDLVAVYPLAGTVGSNVFTADISSYSHGIYYYLVEADIPSGSRKSKPEKFAVLRYP